VRADDPSRGGDDRDQPVVGRLGPRAVGVGEVAAVDLDVVGAEPGDRLGARQPGVGELGIGERAPRHGVLAGGPAREEHVADRADALVPGRVRELEPPGDVPRRVDRRDGRAQRGVDLDPLRPDGDADLLEAELADLRAPADPDDDLVGLDAVPVRGVHDFPAAGGLDAGDLGPRPQVDALGPQPGDEAVDELGLVLGEHAVLALEDGDRDAQARQALPELHRDRPAAEGDDRCRRALGLPDRLARQEARLVQAGDRRARPGPTRSRSG
jgi:hypothetical protein